MKDRRQEQAQVERRTERVIFQRATCDQLKKLSRTISTFRSFASVAELERRVRVQMRQKNVNKHLLVYLSADKNTDSVPQHLTYLSADKNTNSVPQHLTYTLVKHIPY